MASLEKAETLEEKRAALIIKYRKLNVDSTIAYVRELRDKIQEEEVTGGIIIGDGKYTYSARSNAPEMNIELIPATLPPFDIFEHQLVPLHELASPEERKEISEKYHAEPYQFPWIKSVDPISIILGAKPGDVLKITQKSETAGKYDTYRYVV